MTGLIFDIQHFSTHDGPGIRTTVFMKGCPLRCAWCHNPESLKNTAEIMHHPMLCIDCGSCNRACPAQDARRILSEDQLRQKNRCDSCLACVEVCPGGSLERVGKVMTVDEVLAEVIKDVNFYKESEGGVTVSGGEPMLQFGFVYDFLKAAKAAGLHTVIDTSGYGDGGQFEKITEYVDLFLWDIKDTDTARHKLNTGVSLEPILKNLRRVDRLGAKTILRCLIIAGVNSEKPHLDSIIEIYRSLKQCQKVELIRYHLLGDSKYQMLGISMESIEELIPSEETMLQSQEYLLARGVSADFR